MTRTRTAALLPLLLAPWLLAAKAKPAPSPASTAAVTSGERKLVDGAASFRLGKDALQLKSVSGSLQSSSGFQIANRQGRVLGGVIHSNDGFICHHQVP